MQTPLLRAGDKSITGDDFRKLWRAGGGEGFDLIVDARDRIADDDGKSAAFESPAQIVGLRDSPFGDYGRRNASGQFFDQIEIRLDVQMRGFRRITGKRRADKITADLTGEKAFLERRHVCHDRHFQIYFDFFV